MRARAPLDVDLEDKLLYGLTPMRLAYLVAALVAGFGLWSSPWAPSPVRIFACSIIVGAGAVAAWGRWRGRPVDGWVSDLVLFAISAHRLVLDRAWHQRFGGRTAEPVVLPREPTVIVVTGRAPKAGATTLAVELAACLAAKGFPPELWSVRDAPAGQAFIPSSHEPVVSVASVDAGRVCYLDRGAGPFVVGVIPEDALVRQAAMSNQATVVAFPEAAATKAIGDLVDIIVGVR